MTFAILAAILLIAIVVFGIVVQKTNRWIALASGLFAALVAWCIVYISLLYWFSNSQ